MRELARPRGAVLARGVAFLLSGTATIVGAPSHAAQCTLHEDQRLGQLITAPPVTGSVSVDGNLAVVGTQPQADIYRHDGYSWVFEQRITMPVARFAYGVAVEAGVVAIGSPREVTAVGTGAVYVYRHDGTAWVNTARIVAPGDKLGEALAFGRDGNLLLVGSPGFTASTGAVNVFAYEGSTWIEEAKLVSPVGEPSFGSSVAWSSGRAIVGAPAQVGPAGVGQGAAYVFRRSHGDWTEEVEFQGNAASESFGWSVAIDDDTAVAGGFTGFPVPARVYRLEGGAWGLEQELFTSGPTFYGSSVALEGDRLVVGAQCNLGGMGGGCAGRAYLYRRRGTLWSLTTILETAGRNELLGGAGAMDGGRILLWASEPYQAYAFPAAELRVTASTTQPPPGASLTFTVECGSPGRAVAVLVVDIGGMPQHVLLSSGTFGEGGAFVYQTVVPPGLGGIQAQVQAFGFVPSGGVGRSNRVPLLFL